MISWENYEEYMMMHADGELNEAETTELMAFVAKNPQLKSELADYGAVRLTPDTTMIYANKQSLLKEEPVAAKKIIAFPVWKRYSIAAAVAALLFVSLYKVMDGNTNNGNEGVVVAKNDNNNITNNNIASNRITPQEQQVTHENTPNAVTPANTAVARQMTKDVQEEKQAVQQAPATVKENMQVAHQTTRQPVREQIETLPVAQAHEAVATVAPMPVATIQPIPATAPAYARATERVVPEYEQPEQAGEKKTLWDRLPMDNIKKKQIGNIAGAIKNATEGGQKVSIKLEKKKIVLSF